MKRLRFGLQARYLCAAAGAVMVVLAMVAVLLARQAATQRELLQASAGVVGQMFDRSVRDQGESLATSLADALVNPLYYSDLDAIGALVRSAANQQSVSYVLVHDAAGRLVHDGSIDVAGYGRQMRDPLAQGAMAANEPRTQQSAQVLELDYPIRLGEQRLGGLRVGMDLAPVQARQAQTLSMLEQRINLANRRQLGWVVLMMVALVGFACACALYVQRKLVRPIRWLREAARSIEAGDYEVQLPPASRGDEIGELLQTFQLMSRGIARHDREVRHIAYTDALTGLGNRMAFREGMEQRLREAAKAGQVLALLFIDVDEFKRVNDTLGHEVGDEVLLQLAHRIAGVLEGEGGNDALLARFGGDEFVLLVEAGSRGREVLESVTAALAERLLAEIGQPLQVQGRELFLGCSIGISLFPQDAGDATGLVKNGDIAMYQAKLAGKNCFRYYSRGLEHEVERRLYLEQELRGAWDRGELRLVYQPIFAGNDRQVVGAEALLRWQHPVLGAVPPSVFIDVAEQSGLIQALGSKVLQAACQQARQWPCNAAGQAPFVSVNVSARQLRSGDLAAAVERCLLGSGLEAARLHLELTETAVIGDEVLAASLLEKLHRMGVKVWLDDFGTGFSGLSHLRQVPVDGVKIDKSFVADLQNDPDDLALTSAIIAMAHALGITVVAEGIEQQAQLELLNERGCDLLQGYWLARPLEAEPLLQLLGGSLEPVA